MTLAERRVGRSPAVQQRADVVGSVIDCQILVGYAEQAMRAVSCPADSAAASTALSTFALLREKLQWLAGRLEKAA